MPTCAHCGGTGMCKHAVAKTSGSTSGFFTTYTGKFVCPKCGEGISGNITGGGEPTGGRNSASRPVCRVCDGSGYVKQ